MRRQLGIRVITALLLILAVTSPVFAGGAQEEAEAQIEMERQPRQYISPGASEGVQDVLDLPFPEVELPAEERVIVEYNLSVYNTDGELVWSQSEVQEERVGFFGDLFGAERPSVTPPESLVWDGTYQDGEVGDEGELVPDGDYTYQLSIIDDEGAVARTPPFGVTVDNTPPSVRSLTAPEFRIFSPNDDGIRDTVTFRQETTRELSWTGEIVNAEDEVVWRESWENPNEGNRVDDVQPPRELTWDGTYNVGDNAGEVVPEGEYSYRLSSEDRAGNTVTAESEWSVTMSLRAGDVVLSVLSEDGVFSPNGDGVQDSIEMGIEVAEPEGIDTWTFEVAREDNFSSVVASRSGVGVVPDSIEYDGRNEVGNVLGDGLYAARMQIEYENGTIVASEPIGFTVDTTAPSVSLAADTIPTETEQGDPLAFGGTNKRAVRISGRISEEDEWTAVISNETTDQTVRAPISEVGISGPEFTVEWEGTLLDGSPAPDGVYTLYLESTDRAGNSTESQGVRVRKDTRDPEIDLEIAAEDPIISPNDDGVKESVTIRPQFSIAEGIDEFLLEIRDDRDRPVRTRYVRSPFQSFEWRGRNNAGGPVPDGRYTVHFQIIYYNGNRPETSGETAIVVDSTEPEAIVDANTVPQTTDRNDPLVIGGTNKEALEVSGRLSEEEEPWYFVIQTPDTEYRAPIDELGLSAPEFSYRWDGTLPDGTTGPDGSYTLYLENTDRAGNYGRSDRLSVRKDTRETPIDLSLEQNLITPNNDGVDDTVAVDPEYEVTEGIDEVILEIRNNRGRTVRTETSSRPIESFEWDGTNDAGEVVPNGDYTVDFQVIYFNGNEPRITGVGPISLDAEAEETGPPATPPNIRISAGPIPFSPDNDGRNEELTLRLTTRSLTPIVSWSVQILDRNDNIFRQWSGTGEPPTRLTWEGRSEDGELVQSAETYNAVFQVEDSEGFIVAEETEIPIDILVIRESEDRYRIRIPSIRFAPYTADLFEVERELLDQNLDTLQRLATILAEYPERTITIEGHAVHIYWQPGPRKEREQEQVLLPLSRDRAQEVKEALMILGIDRDRMEVVGYGGARPIVPHNDEDNRWKNRRVEFLLDRD